MLKSIIHKIIRTSSYSVFFPQFSLISAFLEQVRQEVPSKWLFFNCVLYILTNGSFNWLISTVVRKVNSVKLFHLLHQGYKCISSLIVYGCSVRFLWSSKAMPFSHTSFSNWPCVWSGKAFSIKKEKHLMWWSPMVYNLLFMRSPDIYVRLGFILFRYNNCDILYHFSGVNWISCGTITSIESIN